MSSSYTIIPANKHCSMESTVKVTSLPGTSTNATSDGIDSVINQIAADSRYDTSAKTVTKLYGGGKEKKFSVILKKKETIIYAYDDIDALKKFIKGKNIKKDNIVYVNDSIYILRPYSKNKFVKLNKY